MSENQVFEYSLFTGQNEITLKMKTYDKYIVLIIEYKNGKIFTAYVNPQQLKDVCKAFIRTKTLKEVLMILHNTIEAGNINLQEVEKGKVIEFQFAIKLASGNFPPFSIRRREFVKCKK